MFEDLVKSLLYSWQNADAEQVEAWARGEAWAELQALAQCQAAQKSAQLTEPTPCPKCGLVRNHAVSCPELIFDTPRQLTQVR